MRLTSQYFKHTLTENKEAFRPLNKVYFCHNKPKITLPILRLLNTAASTTWFSFKGIGYVFWPMIMPLYKTNSRYNEMTCQHTARPMNFLWDLTSQLLQ